MLRMIVRDLRVAPLRTLLTALSMGIGIVALIASVLVGTLGRGYLEAVNARLSGWPATYTITVDGATLTSPESGQRFRAAASGFADGQLAPEYHIDGLTVVTNGETRHPTVAITTSRHGDILPVSVLAGSWLTPDTKPATLEAVVNQAARDYMTEGRITLGTDDGPQRVTAQVTGVVADGADEPTIYINAASFETFCPQLWNPNGLTLLLHPRTGFDENTLRSAIGDLLHDTVGGTVTGWSRSDNASAYESTVTFLRVAFGICAALLLVVSAIGLANIGMAGIEQRSHELLIRRAIGATRTDNALLVVGSSMLLGALVAAVAVGVSLLLVALAPMALPDDIPMRAVPYPWTAAAAASLASIVVSLAGSLAPAIRAARLQPALALR